MMKNTADSLLLIAALNLAHAQETSATKMPGAEQARATWRGLTPEQQTAKQAAAREMMQPYRESMQSPIQARMGRRPFGHR
jgi:hypothetical protein